MSISSESLQLFKFIFSMCDMNFVHPSKIDLNLLFVFDALVAERHVTRAAERVGVTQSAVSHALGRLRLLFNDPLFVRSIHGMTPTSAALAAAPAIRSILEQVEDVIRGERAFDPMKSQREFILGLSDYAAVVLLPRLTAYLEHEAPGISLIVRNASRNVGHAILDDGRAELVAGNFPPPPAHMREELIYEEGFVCACRRGHPALAAGLDLNRYLECRHLQVSTSGKSHGYVDDVLKKRGLCRNVVTTVSHFLMAPFLVESSDLIATEPMRLFSPVTDRLGLMLRPAPLVIPPFRVVQVWHSRHDRDPAHAWLRGAVQICAKSQLGFTKA